jgi:hypothetical protein
MHLASLTALGFQTEVNEGGYLAGTKTTFTSYITYDFIPELSAYIMYPFCPTRSALPSGIQKKKT